MSVSSTRSESPRVGHPPSTVSGTQETVNEEKDCDTDSGTAAEVLANVMVVWMTVVMEVTRNSRVSSCMM